ncbi:MAG TPA: hypothetical protein PKA37_03440, partial [Planctomycetota bacterium]|nr:hypothetical protein [Planctomycetota bacterium]
MAAKRASPCSARATPCGELRVPLVHVAAANFAPCLFNFLRRTSDPAPKGLPKPAQGNALGHVC